MAAVEGMSVPNAPLAPFGGALAEALARGRSEYNARGRAAARAVEAHALLGALRGLEGVVAAVQARDPAVVDRVVSALFDASLELVARAVIGPGARRPAVGQAWCALLEAAPGMLCADPRRVVAATANACSKVADVRGARLPDWAGTMASMAPLAPDVDTWLRAGTVAAWRSGLAHTRAGALAVAARLPADLAALAVGLDASTPAAAVERVLVSLRRDHWSWPPDVAAGVDRPPGIRLVGRIGGFRGFVPDGRFLAPPTVGVRDGVFLVSDGDRAFELHADFFGATLVPVGPASVPPPGRGSLTLAPGGEVRSGQLARSFPALARDVTWASTDSTLVAAQHVSHHVTMIARSGYGL
ncbi:MAG: hypothetical protein ACRELB_06845 [Polyangiaceae bacterium]